MSDAEIEKIIVEFRRDYRKLMASFSEKLADCADLDENKIGSLLCAETEFNFIYQLAVCARLFDISVDEMIEKIDFEGDFKKRLIEVLKKVDKIFNKKETNT